MYNYIGPTASGSGSIANLLTDISATRLNVSQCFLSVFHVSVSVSVRVSQWSDGVRCG